MFYTILQSLPQSAPLAVMRNSSVLSGALGNGKGGKWHVEREDGQKGQGSQLVRRDN